MKKLYLVFEYCSGGELYDGIMKGHGMDEKVAAGVFFQLLLGLNYMHGHNICHRDIKAENCLYLLPGTNAHLKIIDFGLAVEYAHPSISLIT
jgi:serine/threonine protein kinase